ncbi:hypothetical protein PV433_33795 [Paenibacillus sp. GYB004]|uniref:hypothetical protein n=1 Tax=Paenibacillus sp. GYB004 TaxID=2994393 RepID=UPI002F9610ED
MNGIDRIGKMISLAVAIKIQAPYVVNITAHSGCGVEVLILQRLETEEVGFKVVQRFAEVDKHPAVLTDAFEAVEAVANGTYGEVKGSNNCPRCKNSEIGSEDRFCKICGLEIQGIEKTANEVAEGCEK